MDFAEIIESAHRDYHTLRRAVEEIAGLRKMKLEKLCAVEFNEEEFPVYKLDTEFLPERHSACIASGAHGDEYEGPLAVLRFLKPEEEWEEKVLQNFNLTVIPVMSPVTYVAGKREMGYHFNRAFGKRQLPEGMPYWIKKPVMAISDALTEERIDISVDVHSDWEEGIKFYCYERRRNNLPSLARRVAGSIKPRFPVHEGRYVKHSGGLKENVYSGVVPSKKKEHTFEDFMRRKGVPYSLTLEIPGAHSDNPRYSIACGSKALYCVLEEFLKIAETHGLKPRCRRMRAAPAVPALVASQQNSG